MDYSNLTGGLRVQSQIPLDVKEYSLSENDLKDLGIDNNLAFTYTKGLVVYCAEEESRWEWREVKPREENTGLLSNDFTYPDGLITFGIDYGLKSFNFFPYAVDGQTGEQGEQGVKGDQGEDGPEGPTGPKGEKGDAGENGINGADGFSAYELALQEGFEGTETEWLLSLVGKQGPQGETGATGEKGEQGEQNEGALFNTDVLNQNTGVADTKDIISDSLVIPAFKADIGDCIVIKTTIQTFNSYGSNSSQGIYIGLNSSNSISIVGDQEEDLGNLLKIRYIGKEDSEEKLIRIEYRLIVTGKKSCFAEGKAFINDVNPRIITEDLNDFYESTILNPRLCFKNLTNMNSSFEEDTYFNLSGYEMARGLILNVRSLTIELKKKVI